MVLSPSYQDHGRTEFSAGDCVSLSCDGAEGDCFNIAWLFNYNNQQNEDAKELVANGKVRSEDKEERLRVTKECSLEVKKLSKEDEGVYTCRNYRSSKEHEDHAQYDLKLMTSTSRPTTTTEKANTTCTSTSKPGGSGLAAGVALGTAVLLIVGLVLLICWLRRRGNKRPKDTTTIGLNSIRDTLPVIGALHDEHLSVDGDQGGGPTYSSIVLPEGQRSVATAQVEDDSSDAVTYASVRASPRCGEKTGDVDVHYATVNKRGKSQNVFR